MAVSESLMNTPNFSDLAQSIYVYLYTTYYERTEENHSQVKLDSWNITTLDVTYVAVLTAALATLRFLLTKLVFLPIADHYKIPEASRRKVPESAWRFIYFLCIWCYEWYVVVLSNKYKFFEKPETMWYGWSLQSSPPSDIYFIYAIQTAFYLHFTYATLFLDTWRKDSIMMVSHHIFTLILIFISNATRCHNIGALICFVHDMCDIFLEFTKLCLYFKIQGLKEKKWIEMMGNASFICFTAVWFTARLYFYPLKVIYSGAVHPRALKLNIPYDVQMNLLMWGIFILHIYWSMLILNILYRTFTAQKLEDTREVDVAGEISDLQSSKSVRSSICKDKSSE